MAALTITPRQVGDQDGHIMEAQWTLTTADPKGQGIPFPEYSDMTWCVLSTGTTLGGAIIGVETAPVDVDADYSGCKSAAGGAAIAINAAPGCASNIERSKWVRPRLTTVGVGATVLVHVTMRRPNQKRT